MRGVQGKARIGNDARNCGTCNSFRRRVERAAVKELREKFQNEYRTMFESHEERLYFELTDGLPAELFTPTVDMVGSTRSTENKGGETYGTKK